MAEENPPTPPPAQPTGSAYTQGEKITKINVADEIKNSFLDYSMSVIISRALPDVRDGLKPSQRRILFAMHELSLFPGRKHYKCAKICGDTSGRSPSSPAPRIDCTDCASLSCATGSLGFSAPLS